VFEEFIEQLHPLYSRWPEPKSILVMDNAPFHHTEQIEQMCQDAGVKLVYLPLYSPDLNPVNEFFAELKASLNSTGKSIRTIRSKDLTPSWNGVLMW
jgi:transposase